MKRQIMHSLQKTGLKLQKHSPSLLTIVGALGVIATAVLTAKETPKAIRRLEDAKSKKEDGKLTLMETVCAAGPVYIPAIVVGTTTIACVVGANVINVRRQAALVSAYSLAANSLQEYKEKVNDICGPEAVSKVQDTIVDGKESVFVREPSTDLFYEEFSGRWFQIAKEDLIMAEYKLNRNFRLKGYEELNFFYKCLGLDESDIGEGFGWTMEDSIEDGWDWIDISHTKKKSAKHGEYYLLTYDFQPKPTLAFYGFE